MTASSVEPVARSGPPEGTLAAERLRSRLNHDLLKNRLLLSLSRLRAIAAGTVTLEGPPFGLIDDIVESWKLAKEDGSRLGAALERHDALENLVRLPFLRHLDDADWQCIRDMLRDPPNGGRSLRPESLVALVGCVDIALGKLCTESKAQRLPSIQAIDDAIRAAADFSGWLSGHRLHP